MNLSELIAKPVVTSTGEELGYVKNATVGKNFIGTLTCVDAEEEEFYLPAKAILSINDAVVAGSARVNAPTGQPNPIGKNVYSPKGEHLGVIGDVKFDEGEIYAVIAGSSMPYSKLTIGDVAIVKEEKKPKKTAKAAAPLEKPAPAPREAAGIYYDKNLLGRRVKKQVVYQNYILIPKGEIVTPAVIRKAAQHNLLLELKRNTLTE